MTSRALINPLPKNSGVSLRATIQNPRPRKYASDADRQKAFRERQAMIQVRVKPETVETFDRIATTLGYSRQEVVYALLMSGLNNNRNWQQTGIPAFRLPRYEENPIMRKATPAQIAARERFAAMARSGAFKRKAKKNPAKKTVSQKISQLVREGYPQPQAVAIALSEQRAGKVRKNPIEYPDPVSNAVFEVGKYYETRMIGDYNQRIGATILSRTAKSVKIKPRTIVDGREIKDSNMKTSYRVTRGLYNNEVFYPYGRFSMAPIISADYDEAKEGRRSNPADRERKPRVVLITNPKARDAMKYAYALVLDDGGFTYGMDARTPVTFEFSQRDRKRGVYTSYALPSAAVLNPDFQAMVKSLPGQQYIGTLTELRALVKKFI